MFLFDKKRVMIHQPIAGFYEAQIEEFVLEAEELLKLREILTRIYAQRTGITGANSKLLTNSKHGRKNDAKSKLETTNFLGAIATT
ncbi:conserved hypothetical protein [Ricinus communis]|uniref:ATP-dependent Clp protease proteolytic subunit n=1 Tax=Ricinus communis TaxID=3988 RepID=B9SZ21_RICCO|nr:conserved hypothetical protein [Ricinus communis]